jgi:hypothetical protein
VATGTGRAATGAGAGAARRVLVKKEPRGVDVRVAVRTADTGVRMA